MSYAPVICELTLRTADIRQTSIDIGARQKTAGNRRESCGRGETFDLPFSGSGNKE
jgi:hypothetical protein